MGICFVRVFSQRFIVVRRKENAKNLGLGFVFLWTNVATLVTVILFLSGGNVS